MSKIICDVCGTSYQDSATQCPICGCVRPVDIFTEMQPEESNVDRTKNYTYVKGGRFSKANVAKRDKAVTRLDNDYSPLNEEKNIDVKAPKSDKGLVIAVCALLLAIVAVAVYIAIHYFAPSGNIVEQPSIPKETSVSQTDELITQAATVTDISCTDLILSKTELRLNAVGDSYLLDIVISPEDTTDELRFVSDDESVATVSETGEITAMAPGETMITVTCGEVSSQCKVLCLFEEEMVEPTINPDEDDSYQAPYKINKTDVSISVGETFQLKLTDAMGETIPVTWSPTISGICELNGNSVTGAEKGRTELSATYNGETFTCIVRVR